MCQCTVFHANHLEVSQLQGRHKCYSLFASEEVRLRMIQKLFLGYVHTKSIAEPGFKTWISTRKPVLLVITLLYGLH